jgi:hypothetical protein
MNKIGLLIRINKYKQYFESEQKTFVCDSIESAKTELINVLVKNISHLNIDYPDDFNDFEYQWFQRYIKVNAFDYNIFINNEWVEPWELQEIYSDVLEVMQQNEEANPPNFDEIYGEPNPDEEVVDNFSMEKSEQIHEFEKKLTEIIIQSKTCNFKEDQIKECKCEKCKENN